MEVSKTYVTIGANTAPLAAGLNQAKGMVATSTATMTKKLASIGKGMTIAGALIVAGFGLAIKTAKKFEQSMANTASVAGATSEELKKLSDYARKMGEQSVFSASQAADGMYYLASAGMNVNEIMGALEGTLDLAAATASDLAYTSESVAATLSQFGLAAEEAGRVSNVFAAAISGSQATMEKMTNSMSYVGPMAKSMGMTLETTTGILMNLYNAGLNGSKAGTSLRMAFVKLIDPTTKGINALERLKISIEDSSGKMRPFEDIIDDLGKAGMSTADAMDIFGIRAGPAMMALVSQGTGAIREMTEAVTGTNKATEMAAMQIDTFEGAMKLLRSAFEELQITLVQELMPALKGMIEWITEGIKKVTAWMKANPKLTETIVKWTAAIGALMLILGPLFMLLPGISIAILGVKTAVIALISKIQALNMVSTVTNTTIAQGKVSILRILGPIGLFIVAITGIVLGLKKWQEHGEKVREENEKLKASLMSIEEVNDRVKSVEARIKELRSQLELTGESTFLGGDLIKGQIEALEAELRALIGTGKVINEVSAETAKMYQEYYEAMNLATYGITQMAIEMELLEAELQDMKKELSTMVVDSQQWQLLSQSIAEVEQSILNLKQRINEADHTIGTIVATVKGLSQEMSLLTKEYEASSQTLDDNIKYYKSMMDYLNRTNVILQTELMYLGKGSEAYREKQKEIYENTIKLNGMNEALSKLTEPLTGLDLISAKMALLGDSTEDTKEKIKLLAEKAILLKERLAEAIPKTDEWYKIKDALDEIIKSYDKFGEKGRELVEGLVALVEKQRELKKAIEEVGADRTSLAYQKLKIEYNSNEVAIGSLITALNNLETEQNEVAQAAKNLAAAQKTIADEIYELTHTPMENAIRKLNEQKQEYLDLGESISTINKWYDLQIAKLNELNPELDETTKKLKEAGDTGKKSGEFGASSWDNLTITIKRATVALSNFTKEGLAAAIATIKMKFFPLINSLVDTINNTTGIWKKMAEYQLAEAYKTMKEQIDILKYGLDIYNDELNKLGGATNNLANITANATNSMVNSWNNVTNAANGAMTTSWGVPSPVAGGVTATGWGVSSYATGTPYVPQTGMALLHKGEAVVPANENTYNNSFSPTVNLSVQGGGNSNQIAQEVENVLYNMGRQFKRRGFEIIPGRG